MPRPQPAEIQAPRRDTLERRALRARSHSLSAAEDDASRARTPWTVRIVQVELGLAALLVATVPALLAVLLLFLAILSLDGGNGLQTLALSAAAALAMVAAASAICTGIVFLIQSLGRGSTRAWACTLAAALLSGACAAWVTEALLAPQLGLAVTRAAIALAAPSLLATLLLLSPPTLRLVWGAPRRGIAHTVTSSRVPAAP
jgi:hypothetical protein